MDEGHSAEASPVTAPPGAGDDARRIEPRQRTFLGGKLVFGAQDLTADCTIRNLSGHGAKIQCSLTPNLPPDLWVVVIKQALAHRATIAWRRGEEFGARFHEAHDLTTTTDPRLDVVRRVWRQIAS